MCGAGFLEKFECALMKKHFHITRYCPLVLALSLASAGIGMSDPGYLDTTFSTDGKVTRDIGGAYDRANQVLVQMDGQILVAGYSNNGSDNDFLLLRYNTDGTPDTTFGTNGIVTTDFNSGSQDLAWAAVLQTDGKIVLAGGSDADFALARYLPSGELDDTFGTNGLVTTDFADGGESINDLYVDGSGKFVVAGSKNEGAGTDLDIIVARYTVAGVLDSSFGSGGKTIRDFAGYDDHGLAVSQQPDGKIIVTGDAQPVEFGYDQVVLRYDTDGNPDTSFGSNGETLTDINSDWNGGKDLHILSDGRILVAGYAYDGPSTDFTLVQYNSDGTLDTDFGGGGIAVTDFLGGNDIAYGITVQQDGMILLAGVSYTGVPTENFALARYRTDGELDPGFGNAGLATTDFFGNSHDTGTSVTLQTDGQILVAGLADPNFSNSDIALARYDGTPLDIDDSDTSAAAAAAAAEAAVRAAQISRVSRTISRIKHKLRKAKKQKDARKKKKLKTKLRRLRRTLHAL